jgi:hypothetical protein
MERRNAAQSREQVAVQVVHGVVDLDGRGNS